METVDLPAFDSLRISTKKTSVGQLYVFAYKNKWDSEKKQSRKLHREYIGTLEGNGLVRLSKGFIGKRPEFAGRTLQYFENTLIDLNAEKADELKAQLDETKSESEPFFKDSLGFGATWACWQTAVGCGMLKDLRTVFKQDGDDLLRLAIFQFLTEKKHGLVQQMAIRSVAAGCKATFKPEDKRTALQGDRNQDGRVLQTAF